MTVLGFLFSESPLRLMVEMAHTIKAQMVAVETFKLAFDLPLHCLYGDDMGLEPEGCLLKPTGERES
jgi:hypothetical protein